MNDDQQVEILLVEDNPCAGAWTDVDWIAHFLVKK